jgi:hypothetical protein
VFRAIDHRFIVECDDDALAALIDEVFAHCLVDELDVEPDEVIRIDPGPNGLQLVSDEGTSDIAAGRALQTVVSLVNLRGAQRRHPDLPVLHGGAVAFGGEAVLLPGRSGSGKSTLVAALAASGGEYLADELVAVRSAACVSGYPKAITLKPGAWAALPFDRPNRSAAMARHISDVDYIAADDVGALTVLEEALPTTIVFPTWDVDASEVVSTQLSPADALLRLCESAYLPLTAPAFFELAGLAARTPAHGLRYPSGANTVSAVHSLRTDEPVHHELRCHGPSAHDSGIAVADFGDVAVLLARDGALASMTGFDQAVWTAAEADPAHPIHSMITE